MGHPIQIILARQLAGYLSVSVFLVDQNGNLLFYNELFFLQGSLAGHHLNRANRASPPIG